MALTLPTRPLGRTGLAVSVLGLGTVKLGRNEGVKYPHGFELPTDDEARGLIDAARELGISLIDTAPAYGASEERLGGLIADSRDDWTIVTKAGETFADGRSSFDFSPEAIAASVERSLKRLRTDRVECVLIHSDGRDAEIIEHDGVLETLGDLRSRGLCLSIGISTKTLEGAMLALERGAEVLMLAVNPQDRSQLPAVRAAAARGVGVLVKKGLSSGHLGDRPGDRSRAVRESMELSLGEPGVSSVVVGTINPEHLRENVRAAIGAAASIPSQPGDDV
ncbi:MAG: aldo/keto reductase [Phycisphaerales bacterium JB037]